MEDKYVIPEIIGVDIKTVKEEPIEAKDFFVEREMRKENSTSEKDYVHRPSYTLGILQDDCRTNVSDSKEIVKPKVEPDDGESLSDHLIDKLIKSEATGKEENYHDVPEFLPEDTDFLQSEIKTEEVDIDSIKVEINDNDSSEALGQEEYSNENPNPWPFEKAKKVPTMNISQKHRQTNASPEQKQLLLKFLKKNPHLISGKFSNDFTQKDAQILWQELAVLLNSCGGGTNKDWKSWRKTWHDIRSKTKVKQRHFNRYQSGTGGGPVQDRKKEFEREVLEIIKPVSIQGHLNVKESYTDFTFNTSGKDDHLIRFDSSEGNRAKLIDNVENIDEFEPIELECGPSTEETHKINVQKKFTRTPRKKLIYASEAAANYKVSLDRKNYIKAKYYEEKIIILKKFAAAEEKASAAKERIAVAVCRC